jgi:hypothetical protein
MMEIALIAVGVVAVVTAARFVLHWYGIEVDLRPDDD